MRALREDEQDTFRDHTHPIRAAFHPSLALKVNAGTFCCVQHFTRVRIVTEVSLWTGEEASGLLYPKSKLFHTELKWSLLLLYREF